MEKYTESERVRALTTRATYELAVKQRYTPAQAVEMRPGRMVEGVNDSADLMMLAR